MRWSLRKFWRRGFARDKKETIMRGVITTKEVLKHPVMIVRAFGVRVYARCLVRVVAGHGHATFLECI